MRSVCRTPAEPKLQSSRRSVRLIVSLHAARLQVTLLFNDTQVFPPVALASEVRRHRLTSLTPGRHYKMVVSTFSGPYQRAQFIEGRTGETASSLRTRSGQTPAEPDSPLQFPAQ